MQKKVKILDSELSLFDFTFEKKVIEIKETSGNKGLLIYGTYLDENFILCQKVNFKNLEKELIVKELCTDIDKIKFNNVYIFCGNDIHFNFTQIIHSHTDFYQKYTSKKHYTFVEVPDPEIMQKIKNYFSFIH